MIITKAIIGHTAQLSRLGLKEEEEVRMQGELEQVLTYMQVLDTAIPGQPPAHPELPLREDEVSPSTPRDELLKNAPSRDGEAFLVPKAVEQ